MTDKYHRTGRVLVGADLLIKLRFNGGRLIFSRVAQSSTYQHHHPPTNQCTNKSYIQPNNKIYRNKLRFTQLVITSSVTNN